MNRKHSFLIRISALFLCCVLAFPAYTARAEEAAAETVDLTAPGADDPAAPEGSAEDEETPEPAGESEDPQEPAAGSEDPPDPVSGEDPLLSPVPDENEPENDGTPSGDPAEPAVTSEDPETPDPAVTETPAPEEEAPDPAITDPEDPDVGERPSETGDPAAAPAAEPEVIPPDAESSSEEETAAPAPAPGDPPAEEPKDVTPVPTVSPAPEPETVTPVPTVSPAPEPDAKDKDTAPAKDEEPAAAEEEKVVDPAEAGEEPEYRILYNPAYFSSGEEFEAYQEAIGDPVSPPSARTRELRASPPHLASYSAAVNYLRQQMVARQPSVQFYLDTSTAPFNIFKDAIAYTDSCSGQEADAIFGAWNGCGFEGPYYESGYYKYSFTSIKYKTTASQEATLTSEVNAAMSSLNLSGKSDTAKIILIHDYICDHVNYDYEHKGDPEHYPEIYSAYGAMHNGMAVCQGYALLFYRMCKDAGLSVRYMTGPAGGEMHAWNIVRAGGVYYYVDTTWDGQDEETFRDWLLKCPADFPGHTPEEQPLQGAPALSTYTMASVSWLPDPTVTIVFDTICGTSTVSWNSVNGAARFKLYRKLGYEPDSKYKLLTTTTATSYTDSSVTAFGYKYNYMVRGVDQDGFMIGAGIATCFMETEELTASVSIDPSTFKPVITWDAVFGASGVQVYYSTSKNGDYYMLANKTMVPYGTDSVTHSYAQAGQTYFYKLRVTCSQHNLTGPFTEPLYIHCMEAPVLTVKQHSTSYLPVLSWGKDDWAVSYEVWRGLGETGSFQKIYTTTNTKQTDKKAIIGKKYRYKVRAVDANGNYSPFSGVKSLRVCFADVPLTSARATPVYWGVDYGIVSGYSDGSGRFGVSDNVTRGQFVIMLWKANGRPDPVGTKQIFKDVPTSSNYFKAVQWAKEHGYAKGYTGSRKGTFGVNDSITRGQLMMMLWRYEGQPDPVNTKKQTFSDVPVTHSYFKAIQWAYENGITEGYSDGTFGVNRSSTRGHCITFMYRIHQWEDV